MLNSELARYPKATLANVLAVGQRGGDRGRADHAAVADAEGDARHGQVADGGGHGGWSRACTQWYAAGGSRVDANGDGNIDAPGAVVLDTAWKGITDAGLCDRLGQRRCARSWRAASAASTRRRAASTAAGTSTWTRTCAPC